MYSHVARSCLRVSSVPLTERGNIYLCCVRLQPPVSPAAPMLNAGAFWQWKCKRSNPERRFRERGGNHPERWRKMCLFLNQRDIFVGLLAFIKKKSTLSAFNGH